jgi:hypothetical protein
MAILPSFEWSENIFDAPGISTGGDLVALAASKARVVFTSNLDQRLMIIYQGNSHRAPVKVYCSVDATGEVVDENGYPPRLLANDDDLSVSDIQWTRTVYAPSANGTLELYPLTFEAALDGDSVGPSTAIEVPSAPPGEEEDPEFLDGGQL